MDARVISQNKKAVAAGIYRMKAIRAACFGLALSFIPVAAYTADRVTQFTDWVKISEAETKDSRQKHVVQDGESLSDIADMYGVPAALLAHHNSIPDPDSLISGQIVYLPEDNYPQELLLPEEAPAAIPQTAEVKKPQPQAIAPKPSEPEPGKNAVTTPASTDKSLSDRPYAYFGNSESVDEVLRSFAANYSIPVIISESVEGVVNGRIGPLPAVEFLDQVTQLNGLLWYFDGNTLYVYSSSEIQKKILNLQFISAAEFRETLMDIGIWDSRFYWRARPAEGLIYISGPPRYMELVTQTATLLDSKAGDRQRNRLVVKVFPLRYAWADDRSFNFRDQTVTVPGVASLLNQIVQGGSISAPQAGAKSLPGMPPAKSVGGQPADVKKPQVNIQAENVFINADSRLNAVIIHDLETKMSMYESLINTLDKPLAQVEINVSIIDINTNSLDQLGVNWKLGKRKDGSDFIRFNPFKSASDAPRLEDFSTIVNIASGKLLAQVNLLSETGKAKILARPSVLTLDNMQAVLDNSQTFYVKVAGKDSAELFPVTYGSVLKVTPRIVDEVTGRKLHLSVNIQDGGQAANAKGADDIPVVKNSSISTQAVIDENESLLVGGYYYETNTTSNSKIPFLGDLPVIGKAFQNNSANKIKNVRLFLITPRIVNLM